MLESTKRYDLLRSRLRSFTRTLPRLKSIDTRGAVRAWVAVRRLRELLPLLQFNGAATGKLNAKLRRIVRRVELVRQSDARLALFDDLLARERRGRLAAARVRDDLEQQAKRARTELFRKKLGHDVRRAAAKLTDAARNAAYDGRHSHAGPRSAVGGARACCAARRRSENRHSGGRAGLSRLDGSWTCARRFENFDLALNWRPKSRLA